MVDECANGFTRSVGGGGRKRARLGMSRAGNFQGDSGKMFPEK